MLTTIPHLDKTTLPTQKPYESHAFSTMNHKWNSILQQVDIVHKTYLLPRGDLYNHLAHAFNSRLSIIIHSHRLTSISIKRSKQLPVGTYVMGCTGVNEALHLVGTNHVYLGYHGKEDGFWYILIVFHYVGLRIFILLFWGFAIRWLVAHLATIESFFMTCGLSTTRMTTFPLLFVFSSSILSLMINYSRFITFCLSFR